MSKVFLSIFMLLSVFAFAEPRAKFDKIWVDYDIVEESIRGMRIHLKFTVYEMKNLDSYVAIYFKDNKGSWLKDKNQKYNSTAGDVAVYRSLKPGYDEAVYDDLTLFMPYTELDLEPGNYNIRLAVDLIYKSGGLIQHLTAHDIEYSKPVSTINATAIIAEYKTMWLDYDVTENGELGMRIHVKFNVSNMKDREGYVAIYFQKRDGTILYTNVTGYRSVDGEAAVYKLIKPLYQDAVYNDLVVFMPYRALNLPAGQYDLKMLVNLIYKEGGIIKQFTTYNFFYEKK